MSTNKDWNLLIERSRATEENICRWFPHVDYKPLREQLVEWLKSPTQFALVYGFGEGANSYTKLLVSDQIDGLIVGRRADKDAPSTIDISVLVEDETFSLLMFGDRSDQPFLAFLKPDGSRTLLVLREGV